jgi:hypothetical protein
MAVVTKVNGSTQAFSAVGRQIALVSLSKTNITQAELDAAITFIQLTASVTAIGVDSSDGVFAGGTTDVVHVITEGPAPAAGSNFGGVTGVTAAVVAYFPAK